MRSLQLIVVLGCLSTLLACGGGSSNPAQDPPVIPAGNPPPDDPITIPPVDTTAMYRVTVENYWGPDDYPQDYPDNAHLSLFGGGTHNRAVSFWNPGEAPSRGIQDMAETGRIDILLEEEIRPAITQGTADSTIAHRMFTPPPVGDAPGIQTFDIAMTENYPLVTLVSMLGPSPDWFVGVSGLSLRDESGWLESLSVDLPLYDGGSKSNITPVMGGPDIIPPNPISLVAYDVTTGTYRPSLVPQDVAVLKFERMDTLSVTIGVENTP